MTQQPTWLAPALFALFLLGTAGAWSAEDSRGTYTFQGCYHVTADAELPKGVDSGVRCDFRYAAKQDRTAVWTRTLAHVVTADGRELHPRGVSVSGSRFYYNGTPLLHVYTGVPVQLGVLFELPPQTTSLRVLNVLGERHDNVPVQGAPVQEAQVREATGAPAAAVSASPNNWAATLSDCRTVSPDEMVCRATLQRLQE